MKAFPALACALAMGLAAGAGCGDRTLDEVILESGEAQFFVAPGVAFQPGDTPFPFFPKRRGTSQIGHVGLGQAYGFTDGQLTSLKDRGFAFFIPFQVNSGASVIGQYQVTLRYDPTLLVFSQIMGSNPAFASGAGIDPNAPPSMFLEPFEAAPATVVNEGTNPATLVVSATAGAGAAQTGKVNLFNVEFRIPGGVPKDTFIHVDTTVDILLDDVGTDLIPALPVLVISNIDLVPGETPAGVLVGKIK